jgi:hypothetical protein
MVKVKEEVFDVNIALQPIFDGLMLLIGFMRKNVNSIFIIFIIFILLVVGIHFQKLSTQQLHTTGDGFTALSHTFISMTDPISDEVNVSWWHTFLS